MSSGLVAVFTPFESLTHPRNKRTRVHDLFELVVVSLCATIAGADTWADIERFGNGRLVWLPTFLRLKAGIASHDTFGRQERREDTVLPVPRSLRGVANWAGLASLVMVLRMTQVAGREHGEIRYFLSSLPPKVKALAKAIRQHGSIENQLHWVLDVTFSEDASRIRKQHGAQTSAMLRRLAVSILSANTSLQDTIRGKRYRACLSTDTLI